AMSYLRGPLTKEQIRKLKKVDIAPVSFKRKEGKREEKVVKVRPRISDNFPQFFLPHRYSQEFILKKHTITNEDVMGKSTLYSPFLFARCNVLIDKARPPISYTEEKNFICSSDSAKEFFMWKKEEFSIEDLSSSPDADLGFGFRLVNRRLEKKEGFNTARDKLFVEVMRTGGFVVHYSQELKLYSKVEETLGEFEERCAEEFEKLKEEEIEKVQRRYEKKIDRLSDRIERKKMDKERHERDASARKREEALSGAETVLSWVIGRRSMRGLSTASRKRRMSRMSEERAKKAEEMMKDYEEDLKGLKHELEDEIDEIEDKYDDAIEEIRPIEVKVKKKDITLVSFGLLWIPVLKVDFVDGEKYFNTYTAEPID
ncbi:hypothetical protein KAU13_07330, partial [candidate division WOR-3 bacterium]|nr:hypothetical protein [candidate division WOR-3 bacterium]